MSEEVVAKRYAEALFQLGNEKNIQENLVEEFSIVGEVFENNHQLYTFLKHPGITNEKKEQFLNEVFQGVSSDVRNTIKLLVRRHRVGAISSIINHFIYLVNDAKGIAEAKVYSARALSDANIQELETTLAKRFNKKAMRLENMIDPSVIGGVKIRIGNTIFDGSLSGKLRRIERDIITVNN